MDGDDFHAGRYFGDFAGEHFGGEVKRGFCQSVERVWKAGFEEDGAKVWSLVGDLPDAMGGARVGAKDDGTVAVADHVSEGGDDVMDRDGSDAEASGFDGIFRFDTDGTSERGLAILQVTPDGFSVVDPAPKTFQPQGF